MMSSFTSRSMVEADKPFIFATWLKGQRYGCDYFKLMDEKSYYRHYSTYIDRILTHPTTTVLVLCLADEPEVIIGYAVLSSPETLCWAFTKKAWRNKGHMSKLLIAHPRPIKTISGISEVGLKIATAKGWIFDPWS